MVAEWKWKVRKLAGEEAARANKQRMMGELWEERAEQVVKMGAGEVEAEVEVEVEAEMKEEDVGLIGETSELVLQYNTIWSYVSVINKLWVYQTLTLMHNASQP